MIGAIIGDVTGSSYEFDNNTEDYDLDLFREGTTFTDDTVCTIAVADAILHHKSYESALLEWCGKYPGRGYGGRFQMWLTSAVHRPYGSYGNGSAMRVSPVGWAFGDLGTTLAEAERTALPTHNHPEGIKGAQVVAEAIFRLRRGEWDKIQELLISSYGADYERQLPGVGVFDETCQGCVPLSLLIPTLRMRYAQRFTTVEIVIPLLLSWGVWQRPTLESRIHLLRGLSAIFHRICGRSTRSLEIALCRPLPPTYRSRSGRGIKVVSG